VSEQFGDGNGDQAEFAGPAVAGALEGGGHGEEGVGEQADRGPAVPGGPGGDLAAVEPGGLFRELVVLLRGDTERGSTVAGGSFGCPPAGCGR
jgi:hypothetical protein